MTTRAEGVIPTWIRDALQRDPQLASEVAEIVSSRRATTKNTESRCPKLARACARLVLELRREGHVDAAAQLEGAAIEAVELVRRGDL